MFYPFRDESDLLLDSSYIKKFGEVGVTDVVNINKLKSEPYGDFVDQALLEFRASSLQCDAFADEENAEVEASLNDEVNAIPETKFRSLAVFYADNIEIEDSKYPGMSILSVNKPTLGLLQ